MSYEVTGKLIEKYDTQRVSDRFQKREFVLEFTEMINGQPSQYPNFIKLTLVQQKVEIIDRFNVGQTVKVNFNLRGSRYEKDGKISYFTNLDAWRIEQAQEGGNDGGYNGGNQQQQQQPQGNYSNNNGGNNGGNWSNSNGGNNNNNGNNGGNWTGGNNTGNGNNTAFSNAPAGGGGESSDDLPF